MSSIIDSAGRIVIPSKFRMESGLTSGTEVEFEVLEDGALLIRPRRQRMRIDRSGKLPVLTSDMSNEVLTNAEVMDTLDRVRK